MISDGQMATTATAAATTATTATTTKTAVLEMEEVIERVGEVGTFSPKLGEILTFLLAETRNIRQEDDGFLYLSKTTANVVFILIKFFFICVECRTFPFSFSNTYSIL
jgi:hypothetical protein